eukprot:m51a1_g11862 hypothetical protein (779) ;mRNA; f:514191-516968
MGDDVYAIEVVRLFDCLLLEMDATFRLDRYTGAVDDLTLEHFVRLGPSPPWQPLRRTIDEVKKLGPPGVELVFATKPSALGYLLRSTRRVASGEIVGVAFGDVVERQVAETVSPPSAGVVAGLCGVLGIDQAMRGSPFPRWLMHQCRGSNVGMQPLVVSDGASSYVWLVAVASRDIEVGDILSTDYRWTDVKAEDLRVCWCPECRGRGIIGKAAKNVDVEAFLLSSRMSASASVVDSIGVEEPSDTSSDTSTDGDIRLEVKDKAAHAEAGQFAQQREVRYLWPDSDTDTYPDSSEDDTSEGFEEELSCEFREALMTSKAFKRFSRSYEYAVVCRDWSAALETVAAMGPRTSQFVEKPVPGLFISLSDAKGVSVIYLVLQYISFRQSGTKRTDFWKLQAMAKSAEAELQATTTFKNLYRRDLKRISPLVAVDVQIRGSRNPESPDALWFRGELMDDTVRTVLADCPHGSRNPLIMWNCRYSSGRKPHNFISPLPGGGIQKPSMPKHRFIMDLVSEPAEHPVAHADEKSTKDKKPPRVSCSDSGLRKRLRSPRMGPPATDPVAPHKGKGLLSPLPMEELIQVVADDELEPAEKPSKRARDGVAIDSPVAAAAPAAPGMELHRAAEAPPRAAPVAPMAEPPVQAPQVPTVQQADAVLQVAPVPLLESAPVAYQALQPVLTEIFDKLMTRFEAVHSAAPQHQQKGQPYPAPPLDTPINTDALPSKLKVAVSVARMNLLPPRTAKLVLTVAEFLSDPEALDRTSASLVIQALNDSLEHMKTHT